jgi:hypothetical protein
MLQQVPDSKFRLEDGHRKFLRNRGNIAVYTKLKGKGKGRSIGAFRHWCLQAYCIITPDWVHSFISKHTKQAWALSVSEWANYIKEFS